MGELVKSMAMNLLEGKDLVSVSLPVIIFDARSFLERLTDNWSSLDFATSAASKQTKGGKMKERRGKKPTTTCKKKKKKMPPTL